MFNSYLTSPEKRTRMIVTIEKCLSNPFFPVGVPGGIVAGIFLGVICSWSVGGGWRMAIILGVPFSLFWTICLPALFRHVLSTQLAAVKSGKFNWPDCFKPSTNAWGLFKYFTVALVLLPLLAVGLAMLFIHYSPINSGQPCLGL